MGGFVTFLWVILMKNRRFRREQIGMKLEEKLAKIIQIFSYKMIPNKYNNYSQFIWK
jgi:hypothetical protein